MRLKNFRYEELKQEVSDLLETYNITSYPINLEELATKMRISLVKYSSFPHDVRKMIVCKSKDSFTVTVRNKSYILFNDANIETRIRFSIAHEIAQHLANKPGAS